MIEFARELKDARRIVLKTIKFNNNQIQTEGAMSLFKVLKK